MFRDILLRLKVLEEEVGRMRKNMLNTLKESMDLNALGLTEFLEDIEEEPINKPINKEPINKPKKKSIEDVDDEIEVYKGDDVDTGSAHNVRIIRPKDTVEPEVDETVIDDGGDEEISLDDEGGDDIDLGGEDEDLGDDSSEDVDLEGEEGGDSGEELVIEDKEEISLDDEGEDDIDLGGDEAGEDEGDDIDLGGEDEDLGDEEDLGDMEADAEDAMEEVETEPVKFAELDLGDEFKLDPEDDEIWEKISDTERANKETGKKMRVFDKDVTDCFRVIEGEGDELEDEGSDDLLGMGSDEESSDEEIDLPESIDLNSLISNILLNEGTDNG